MRNKSGYDDPYLLDMARERHCMMRVPMVCNDDTRTTVAAHSNEQAHNKGRGYKADDDYSVWACARCHTWYDSSMNATRAERQTFFRYALDRQLIAWRAVVNNPMERRAFREAAQKALDRHALRDAPLKAFNA